MVHVHTDEITLTALPQHRHFWSKNLFLCCTVLFNGLWSNKHGFDVPMPQSNLRHFVDKSLVYDLLTNISPHNFICKMCTISQKVALSFRNDQLYINIYYMDYEF